MEVNINGTTLRAHKEMSLLDLAREHNIFIPTLCHHPALEPFGSCRLCTVEIKHRGGVKLDTACTHPAQEGLSVQTDTDRVKQVRKMVLSFLLARCPDVSLLHELAAQLGLDATSLPYQGKRDQRCILCGRCVRVCREIIGKRAISFAFRGTVRRPSSPFGAQAEDCIGCTACEYICPTGAVTVQREKDALAISPWNTEVSLLTCPGCGASEVTRKTADHVLEKMPVHKKPTWLCEKCRRKETVRLVEEIPGVKMRGVKNKRS